MRTESNRTRERMHWMEKRTASKSDCDSENRFQCDWHGSKTADKERKLENNHGWNKLKCNYNVVVDNGTIVERMEDTGKLI
mmetsp:Transcript_17117/g.35810  ORF Transcript_17117/g.35810 Transcript_17117/m.35810 type:complete len:81 (-) Transcript_17117:44-286(-)